MSKSKNQYHLEELLESYAAGKIPQRKDMPKDQKEESQKKPKRKPAGHWLDLGNIESELRKAIERNNGEFPTFTWLEQHDLSSLGQAIHRHHGGMNVIKNSFGFNEGGREYGYLQKWEHVEQELHEISENLGHFPTQKELIRMGESSLANAIDKDYGGFIQTRERMGHKLERNKNGHWENFDHVKEELERLIEENDGVFPKGEYIRSASKKGLLDGITRYHGGLPAVREQMGYEEGYKQRGYWKEWQNVVDEISQVVETIGNIPTARDLVDLKKGSLTVAMQKYHGGFSHSLKRFLNQQSNSSSDEELESLLESYVNGGQHE